MLKTPRFRYCASYLFAGLVTGIRNNMKNKLMPLWDKIMLRKRYIKNGKKVAF